MIFPVDPNPSIVYNYRRFVAIIRFMNPLSNFNNGTAVFPSREESNLLRRAPSNVNDVRLNPFCLDDFDLKALKKRPRVIVTNESHVTINEEVSVEYVAPPSFSFLHRVCAPIPAAGLFLDWLIALTVALRMVRAMRRPDTIALVNLGSPSGSLFCLLNSLKWFRSGPVLAYRVLIPPNSGRLKTSLMGRALGSANLVALWSRTQLENYHRTFGWPRRKFVFLPYKSNHSKFASNPMPVGDYIFSGGNSERDYKTLFEAVDGLSIPVIVSSTKPEVTQGLNIPANVILVKAEEPAFERLMAGSRIVAMCVKADISRAAGEPTILNAMWHGKPVVAADNVAASEYIQEGIDGFVVPAGAAGQMRARILELWKDPALGSRMGEAGRSKVAGLYTHDQWKFRLLALAMLAFSDAQTL